MRDALAGLAFLAIKRKFLSSLALKHCLGSSHLGLLSRKTLDHTLQKMSKMKNGMTEYEKYK